MLTIRWADLANAEDVDTIVRLTNEYAKDPNASGKELPQHILRAIPALLEEHPAALAAIALDGDEPVGLATCVLSLSTFAAKPILNIHDIVVLKDKRGAGIGASLMREVESEAMRRGCCKVSLEVADGNPARHLYEREGFVPSGTFMTKAIE